ncbi:hypothetical protein ACHAPU_010130 [Fusarium lateritium]
MPALFQMVWALVLRIYAGKSQSVFGYLASGRDAPIDGINDAVGPFVSMLVCLVDWNRHGGPVAADIARQIQGASADSMGHQASSLAEMYDALANPDAVPLFNTAINCLPSTTPNDGSDSDALIAFEELSMMDPTEFDLFLIVGGAGGESGDASVNVKLDYSLSSISHKHTVNVAATVSHILSEFIRDPYRAPNELASRLSTHLVSLRIGRDCKVPLCFEKSMWAVVSILAAVQAGGYFVLLDPSHPESLLSMIMDVIKPTVTLCSPLISRTKRFKKPAEISPQLTILEIDESSLRSLTQPNPSLERHQKTIISPDDDLYIVFTSGTTGTSKGAVATHRALTTGLYELVEACGIISLAPSLRSLQFASYSLDTSTGDMFGTFKAGGCLCIPREEDRSPAGITAFIKLSGANYAGFTPSFAAHLDPKLLPSLKVHVMAVEPLSASLVSI